MALDHYKCIGFLYHEPHSVYPEDYFTYYYKTWTQAEFLRDLHADNLPNGMLLRSPSGFLCMIDGRRIRQLGPDFLSKHE